MSARHRPLTEPQTLALFDEAPVVHLSFAGPTGPVIRPLHAVAWEGVIWFHGRRSAERLAAVGQRASAVAHRSIASLPSWFFDPERPCPATTWYQSALAEGTLVEEPDLARRAVILERFMQRYQPEGRYRPLDPSRDQKDLRAGLLVFGLAPDRLSGRVKAGFHLSSEKLLAVLAQLWRRGGPGDLAAIDAIRGWNPDLPRPDFLAAPADLRLCPGADEAEAVAALLADSYWNQGLPAATLRAAQLGATAWIVAVDQGAVVGSARAISDGAKFAWIYDVIVRPDWRGRGLGEALMRTLLDHPALRATRVVRLGTRDAQGFYARLGFVPSAALPPRPFAVTEMARLQG